MVEELLFSLKFIRCKGYILNCLSQSKTRHSTWVYQDLFGISD